ncbi:hypothetical protein DL767_002146 [Monosporascus sp. MG133]|nr:hypothetical protein DL767_002146 [Monosporascus sp. MG133]
MKLTREEKNYLASLDSFVEEKGLREFYPENCTALVDIARDADAHVKGVTPELISSPEIARSLAKLSLYDIVLLLDDSSSMRTEENGLRISALHTFLKRISAIARLFDPAGISIRFINHDEEYDSVTDEATINQIISEVSFDGGTMIGTMLKNRIVDPLVVQPAQAKQLKKPVLIIMITDGQCAGTLKQTITYALDALNQTDYTDAAVAFQIAQVGSDRSARAFINGLDSDPVVGHAFANVGEEGIERLEASAEDEDFDHDLWLVKLMVGAVDKSDLEF